MDDYLFLWRARAQFPPRRWLWLAPIGLINSALPFVLFAYAAERAPAAIGAICNAMTVLFAALIAFLFFGEKIGMRRAGALLVGFAGVVVLATAKVSGLSIEHVEETDDLMPHMDDDDSSSAGLSDDIGPGIHELEVEVGNESTAQKVRDAVQELALELDVFVEYETDEG